MFTTRVNIHVNVRTKIRESPRGKAVTDTPIAVCRLALPDSHHPEDFPYFKSNSFFVIV